MRKTKRPLTAEEKKKKKKSSLTTWLLVLIMLTVLGVELLIKHLMDKDGAEE